MFGIRKIADGDVERLAQEAGVELPLEQTQVWATYQRSVPGRDYWGSLAIDHDDQTAGAVSLLSYETHGYTFLRAAHGPVWLEQLSAEDELAAYQALADGLHKMDHAIVFVRCAVRDELPITCPTLSTVPYNKTVVIDLTGGDDEILSKFKPRGRRDVRKALRESPVECANETEQAARSFEEYYDVMVETGKRDGFAPAPMSDYEDMIRMLGRDHCRVYAGREDGRVVTWSIVTSNGTRAVRYYGASRTGTMRQHVTDKLVYFECCDLGHDGFTSYDMMGIGDEEFAPSLMGLNEFKCKFSKEIQPVDPDRDIPLRKAFYKTLVAAKGARERLGHH